MSPKKQLQSGCIFFDCYIRFCIFAASLKQMAEKINKDY